MPRYLGKCSLEIVTPPPRSQPLDLFLINQLLFTTTTKLSVPRTLPL